MKHKKIATWVLIMISMMMSATAFAKPTLKRLSLNPYGSHLEEASFVQSQSQAPIIFPPNYRPALAHGFTIPDDYKGGSLTLVLLVESQATNCDFHLRPNFLFRMQVGAEPSDTGAEFRALKASTTPFTLINGGIVFAAPDTVKETVEVQFEISDEGSPRPFQPGDGIHFGLFRETLSGNEAPDRDTCYHPLHIGGMSIVYSDSPIRPVGGLKNR